MESGYVRVADKSDIGMGKMKKVTLGEVAVLIANVNGNYYAVDNMCTHFGGDLSEGFLEGNVVTCPNHRAKFDVTTGKVVSHPAEALGRPDIEDLPTYLVKAENQYIMVKV
jgi:nitrite reductase/ring-hydroxylating ferredoxin subunit